MNRKTANRNHLLHNFCWLAIVLICTKGYIASLAQIKIKFTAISWQANVCLGGNNSFYSHFGAAWRVLSWAKWIFMILLLLVSCMKHTSVNLIVSTPLNSCWEHKHRKNLEWANFLDKLGRYFWKRCKNFAIIIATLDLPNACKRSSFTRLLNGVASILFSFKASMGLSF